MRTTWMAIEIVIHRGHLRHSNPSVVLVAKVGNNVREKTGNAFLLVILVTSWQKR